MSRVSVSRRCHQALAVAIIRVPAGLTWELEHAFNFEVDACHRLGVCSTLLVEYKQAALVGTTVLCRRRQPSSPRWSTRVLCCGKSDCVSSFRGSTWVSRPNCTFSPGER